MVTWITSFFLAQKAEDLVLRLASRVLMVSQCFQPTSEHIRPRFVKRRPGLKRVTRRASGTTIRFFLSYGGGMPSNT